MDGINEARHEAGLALKSLDATEAFPPINPAELLQGPPRAQANQGRGREQSWLMDPELLERQWEEVRVSVAMDTATLGATAPIAPEAMKQLDELAESAGLRVTIGDDSGLLVQFGLPLVPPDDPAPGAPPSTPIVSSPSLSRERGMDPPALT